MGRQRCSTSKRTAATWIQAAPLHPPPCRPTCVEGQAGQAAAGAAPRAQGHLQRQLRLGAQRGSRLLGRLAEGGGQQRVECLQRRGQGVLDVDDAWTLSSNMHQATHC